MTLDKLFAELQADFSETEANRYLNEFAFVVKEHDSLLGSKPRATASADHVDILLDQFGKDRVELAEQIEVTPISRKRFENLGLSISSEMEDQFERYRFFLLNIPITVVPRSGWIFQTLECVLEFNPEQQKGERPIAYQIFPDEKWQNLIKAKQSLKVGLNEHLEFKPDSNFMRILTKQIELPLSAQIGVDFSGAAELVIGPMEYNIKRPKVMSRGAKTPKPYWRLEGAENTTYEEPKLAVVLKVPKDTPRVDAVGALKATADLSTWSAYKEELLDYVQEKAKTFFKKGAPTRNGRLWLDLTA